MYGLYLWLENVQQRLKLSLCAGTSVDNTGTKSPREEKHKSHSVYMLNGPEAGRLIIQKMAPANVDAHSITRKRRHFEV